MSNNPADALRHVPQPMEFPADDPFRHDALGREKLAEKLTYLVKSFAGQSFVLAINGVWGSGKSVFLTMWEASLTKQGFRTLRFNAWENDHSEDPFASVFAEFRNLAESAETEKKSGLTAWYQSAKKKAMPIAAKVTAGAIKHATMGLLDINGDAESIIGNLAEATAQHALDKAESEKKSIAAFRDELGEFVKRAGTQDKPVVYFVDELDRCRPTYAISVLERVKHLLNVPGVVFVFAWDRNQLNETVRSVYGRQTDPSGYLFRFVDLEFNLPATSHANFCYSLMQRLGLYDYVKARGSRALPETISRIFPKLAKNLKLSIRDQEKTFTAFSVVLRTTSAIDWNYLEHLLVLIMLRVKRPVIYLAICALATNSTDAGDKFQLLVEKQLPDALGKSYWNSAKGRSLEGHLLFMLPEGQRNAMGKYASVISPQSQSTLPDAERQMQRAYQDSLISDAAGGILGSLIHMMEFSERFL